MVLHFDSSAGCRVAIWFPACLAALFPNGHNVTCSTLFLRDGISCLRRRWLLPETPATYFLLFGGGCWMTADSAWLAVDDKC